MQWKGLPIVIFGTGGTSIEAYHIIKRINRENIQPAFHFIGFVEADEVQVGKDVVDGFSVVSWDDHFSDFAATFPQLGVVVPLGIPSVKFRICEKLVDVPNIVFPNIVHPNAIQGIEQIELGVGNVIYAGVTMTCGISLGNFNVVNPQVAIGHDTVIGSYNAINPLASISGNVHIGDRCLIGTGANILQQLTIGDDATIGAGAVVTKNIEPGDTVIGVPAKSMK